MKKIIAVAFALLSLAGPANAGKCSNTNRLVNEFTSSSESFNGVNIDQFASTIDRIKYLSPVQKAYLKADLYRSFPGTEENLQIILKKLSIYCNKKIDPKTYLSDDYSNGYFMVGNELYPSE